MLRAVIKRSTWYRQLKPPVQSAVEAYPPDRFYQHGPTGHTVSIHCYSACGKRCTVSLLKVNNPALKSDAELPGIYLEDLTLLPRQPYEREE